MAGQGQQQMEQCIHILGLLIWLFRQGNIILQMRDLEAAMPSLSHTGVYAIIWLSGLELVLLEGMFVYVIIMTFTNTFYLLLRPRNKEELFNLRHASARNVVERIFGVVKKRWSILTRPSQFSMGIQAQIPPALAALHNFIHTHDSGDVYQYTSDGFGEPLRDGDEDPEPGQPDTGVLAHTAVSQAEKAAAGRRRDRIAEQMWASYQEYVGNN